METILVIDDEPGAQESFRMVLKDDYHVIIAENGKKALEELGRNPVDLVILDMIMPGMDGLEVLDRIKKSSDCPEVIMVTVATKIGTAVTAMKLGAYDYIAKPFDITELRIVVDKALNKRRLIKEVARLESKLNQTRGRLKMSALKPAPGVENKKDISKALSSRTGALSSRTGALSSRTSLDEARNRFERELIKEALKRCAGVQTKAAKLLKTSRRILRYRMDKLDIK